MYFKAFLTIMILTFTLQSWTKADDISDFQIEGMSIGDSLLDFMSINEIKKAEENSTYYKDKRYIVIFSNKSSEKYQQIEVTYKPNDKNFLIHNLVGRITYPDNYKKCKKDKSDIVLEIKELLKNAEMFERESPHGTDKSNESIVDQTDFYPKSGGFARASCTDWSEKMFTENGWEDTLKVMVGSEEFLNFVTYEAYN